ncbi:alpha/beta hydrolase [Gordonia sp. CPCC 205515]|uniref:alpha/beta fold hydrolase n=1 Tax=Gordonia sp. CPCC 205515 TaxID=3140791 RepID=UPI003AF349D3
MRFMQRQGPSGDLRLAVRTFGEPTDGVPVLLVHGMATDHSTWRSLAAQCERADRPVISVDLRGHGRSAHAPSYLLDDFRDDLRFVLDELQVARVDVVAHSLGAQGTLRLAMADPDRIGRMVLEEIPPMPRHQADVDEGITAGASLGETIRGIGWALLNPAPLVRFDRSMMGAVSPQFTVADPQWWADLAEVGSPTLVISGGSRSFLPPQHLRTLSETLPDGQFTLIDAGHSVHRDRRGEFNRVVAGFLGDQ